MGKRSIASRVSSAGKMAQSGYIFLNCTGVPMKFTVHDVTMDDNFEPLSTVTKGQEPCIFCVDSGVNLQDEGHTFIEGPQMKKEQKLVATNNNRGKEFVGIEDDPLKIDLKISSFKMIKGIPIENIGTYSYIIKYQREVKQSPPP